jgi:hypothetical protein
MGEIINIYGERNSGTNFLHKLLRERFAIENSRQILIIGNQVRYPDQNTIEWKHDYPDLNKLSKYPKIFVICIIRNLNDWVNSMFNRPHHIQKKSDETIYEFANRFLYPNQKSLECSTTLIQESNKPAGSLSSHHANMDVCRTGDRIQIIFDRTKLLGLRYKKYKIYKKIKNSILVSLDYLQKGTVEQNIFLDFVQDKFFPDSNTNFTKQAGYHENYKDSKYPKLDFSKLEDYDKELEVEIDDLTFTINE